MMNGRKTLLVFHSSFLVPRLSFLGRACVMVGEPDPPTSATQELSPAATQDSKTPSTRLSPSLEKIESVTATSAEPVPSHLLELPPDEKDLPPGRPAAGQILGDFQLLEVLGSGSFATVYLAQQIS